MYCLFVFLAILFWKPNIVYEAIKLVVDFMPEDRPTFCSCCCLARILVYTAESISYRSVKLNLDLVFIVTVSESHTKRLHIAWLCFRTEAGLQDISQYL